MAKAYTHQRLDIADKTALDAYILLFTAGAQRKSNFPIGDQFVTANGKVNVIVSNDGTTVATIAVGAQVA
jgi:hypothetical protein